MGRKVLSALGLSSIKKLWRIWRVPFVCLAALCSTAFSCPKAFAAGFWSTENQNSVSISVTNSQGSADQNAPKGSSSSSSRSGCTWEVQDLSPSQISALHLPNLGQNGHWDSVNCPSTTQLPSPSQDVYWQDFAGAIIAFVWVKNSQGPTFNLSELLGLAKNKLVLPSPSILINPNPSVVGLPTYFSLANTLAPNLSASASVAGFSATVYAVAKETIWNFGDGNFIDCEIGPVATQTPSCPHVYNHSSFGQPYIGANNEPAYQVDVDVIWQISYSVSNGAKGMLPVIKTSSTALVSVEQIEAVLN